MASGVNWRLDTLTKTQKNFLYQLSYWATDNQVEVIRQFSQSLHPNLAEDHQSDIKRVDCNEKPYIIEASQNWLSTYENTFEHQYEMNEYAACNTLIRPSLRRAAIWLINANWRNLGVIDLQGKRQNYSTVSPKKPVQQYLSDSMLEK